MCNSYKKQACFQDFGHSNGHHDHGHEHHNHDHAEAHAEILCALERLESKVNLLQESLDLLILEELECNCDDCESEDLECEENCEC